ncbi:type II toxin-antitoxin system RelE/ParE family toxin [Candidatus Woesearchaeota archaeon]|nr:type II toxin-antitoxin system RelE/ParE family toxin [Candidatus Woesearchaeota archaeon]
MYEVEFSDKALRQFKKLEKNIQERVISTLERIKTRPESYITKQVGDPSYKLRVGDYRVILDIDRVRLKLSINKVGHRRNIYKLP